MKHILLVLAGFILCLLPVNAQKEPQAKEILDKTANAFNKSGGIEASFTLTPYQQGTPQQSMKGEIQLKGNKFHMITPEIITWFNGKTQWSYLVYNEEVNISNPTKEELESINPYSFISLYKQGYNYTVGTTRTYSGKAVYEINLIAETPKQQLAAITLYISQNDYFPVYIKAKENGKDYNVVTLDSYKTNSKLNDAIFSFNPKQYPKVEVIDLR